MKLESISPCAYGSQSCRLLKLTPASVPVLVNTRGLAPGSYADIIGVVSSGAANSPLRVPVNLTLNPAPVINTVLSGSVLIGIPLVFFLGPATVG